MGQGLNNLAFLLRQSQRRDVDAVQDLINAFQPKLKKSLYQVEVQERDDLEQELKVKMIENIYDYDLNDIPGFYEFISRIEKNITLS